MLDTVKSPVDDRFKSCQPPRIVKLGETSDSECQVRRRFTFHSKFMNLEEYSFHLFLHHTAQVMHCLPACLGPPLPHIFA